MAVLVVDEAAHGGGVEVDREREAVVVGLVVCQADHRRRVPEPHATNHKMPPKISTHMKELGMIVGKEKVEEAGRVSETWGIGQ